LTVGTYPEPAEPPLGRQAARGTQPTRLESSLVGWVPYRGWDGAVSVLVVDPRDLLHAARPAGGETTAIGPDPTRALGTPPPHGRLPSGRLRRLQSVLRVPASRQ